MVELYQLKWLRSSLTDITTDKDFTEKRSLKTWSSLANTFICDYLSGKDQHYFTPSGH